MNRRTFIHRFPNGVTATLSLGTERGRIAQMVVRWHPAIPPPPVVRALLAEYRCWRNESLATFATENGLDPRGVLIIET